MTEWQPIETAPKDKPILGYGIWQGEIFGVVSEPAIDIIQGGPGQRTYHCVGEEGWWECLTGDAYACWLKPTHWQPLPEPPK